MEDDEKKKRHWIPNPDGKGLPSKKWRLETATTRVPKVHKPLINELAIALDQGSITPEQVEAMIRGETPTPRRANPPAEKRYLTQDEYNLIERWVPHVEREKVELAGFGWLFDAPGTALGNKYFCIKNLGDLLDWIHTSEGAAAWAAASKSPTTSPAGAIKGDNRLLLASSIMHSEDRPLSAIIKKGTALAAAVMASPGSEEEGAIAQELHDAIDTPKQAGRAKTITTLAKKLAIAVLGWGEEE